MKKILLRTGYLGLGAIEQLAFDIALGLKDKFEITLAIESYTNNHLVEKLPKEIKHFYLKPEAFEKKLGRLKEGRKNILEKVQYEYLRWMDKRICCNTINEYIKKHGDFDLFIDYDGMAAKYAEKIHIEKKIIWQHTSLHTNTKRTEQRLKKYDKVVLLCDDMKADYEKNFPEIKEKFVRMYNFLDFARIERMQEDESELSAEDRMKMKESYAISIARLDYPKDFDTLMAAFSILKQKGIHEKLYIIGEGEQREDLERKIKEQDLEDTVYLLGRKMNPYIWLKEASMFVHSSKREGFPAVLLEALVCHKMIISSDCMTGPREILESGKNGELYEVGDYKTLEILLEKYIKDPSLKEKFIANAKLRAEEFRKDRIVGKCGRFFEAVIEGGEIEA